jgi:hypothetical protein
VIKKHVMTRYVKTCLFTIHSFADTEPSTGSSNAGCRLGMGYGQDHPFTRKEALSTYTFFFETGTPNVISALDTQDEFLLITNLTHFFILFIYFTSLHVSSNSVLIIRRVNYINT